ncbi:hypothetical protein QE152_g32102 [Popillia japonica]|uniref:Uncharacterized protein n=1 Tax=Popillia japonica TaxID=7064 RepID=A0AAW1J031_POPJA
MIYASTTNFKKLGTANIRYNSNRALGQFHTSSSQSSSTSSSNRDQFDGTPCARAIPHFFQPIIFHLFIQPRAIPHFFQPIIFHLFIQQGPIRRYPGRFFPQFRRTRPEQR